jgi:hypothetical protein
MRIVRIMSIVMLAGLLGLVGAEAQVPPAFTYQGVLQDNHGNPVPDGDYTVRFKLYPAATGGTALWTESQTVACEDGRGRRLGHRRRRHLPRTGPGGHRQHAVDRR